jgi:2-aminoadipate transaminase
LDGTPTQGGFSVNCEYSKTSKRIRRSEIRELLKYSRKPGVISFGGGLPDASLFPIDEIAEITSQVLKAKGYLALQYGPTPGEPEMLEAIRGHMAQFGDEADLSEICVTSSSQQGLDLLTLLFLEEETPLIMELPSYIGGVQAFHRSGAEMIGVPMDSNGMDLGRLEAILDDLAKKGKKARFIYTIPDFQNPSGVTLSLERRKRLIEIAHAGAIPLVEDSPYRELSFTGKTLPSLWALSGGKGVIMMKTFSKVLFPGMRMGWLVADDQCIDKIVMLKQSVDLCTPSFTQLILAEYIRRGKMKVSIDRAIACYKPKLRAMLDALRKHMPEGVRWSEPTGGMFLWLTLPEAIDTKVIFETVIAHNVAYVIGQPFHCDGSGANTLRLNYSFPAIEQIETGIAHLAAAIKEVV